MDVGDFLRELGLDQYEAAFRYNGIDIRVLPKLTAEDLKDLGVAMVGHRRVLLEAIAALRQPTAPPVTAGADAPDAAPVVGNQASSTTEAERRPLSVMFCDLIGSTALSSRLDPEDLREVIRTYQTCVASTIQKFEGFIARYVGDGVLIYFGWPEARETDAERAVRAGQAVAAAVSKAPIGGHPLQVRIGIATGLVVIGDPIGAGDSRQQTAVGETPNLAARLQGLAGPGQVVIDAATRRQIGGLFECQDLGAVELKGLPSAVPAWLVLSAGMTESRFEALHGSTMTPLVGRDEEMELLLRRWGQAKAGSGRVVLISAEAGVGKSRVAEALAERIAAEPHVRLRYFCSPHHQDSALYPVIAQMEWAAGFVHLDPAAARLTKLQALLAATAPPAEDVALIAELHSLPSVDLAPPLDLTPQRKKTKTFEALLRQVEGLSRPQPVLMIFDDIHWIDPSSRELLDRVIEGVAGWPVLLLAVFRPEFQPPWIGQPHVMMLTLPRLDRRYTAAMVTNIAGNVALPVEIVEEIAERTDGVPLFVEELTKAVLESGAQAPAALSSVPQSTLSVPATLHASLMARLDRLGPAAKDVAQTGAAIGREFGFELLASVSGLSEPQLHEALDRLTNAGLLFVRGTPPQSRYIFKHALVRDAAYSGLLRGRRTQIHSVIASNLGKQFPEIAEAQPETLAHHLSEAGQIEKAIEYWLRAGKNAAVRSANLEAIAHLQRGIASIAQLPVSQERDRLELNLQFALGPCVMAAQGPTGQAVEIFMRARELCDRLGDAPEYLQIMFWLAATSAVRGELPQASEALTTHIAHAETRGDRPALLNSLRGQAMVLMFMGRLAEAHIMIERAVEGFEASDEATRQAARAAGQDVGAAGLALMSWILWLLGQTDASVARIAAASRRADAIEHPHTCAYVSYYAAVLHAFRGEYAIALGHAERCLQLAEEHGYRQWRGLAFAVRGICAIELDPSVDVLDKVLDVLHQYRTAGYQMGATAIYVLLCPSLLAHDRAESALELIEHGLSIVHSNTEVIFASELHRWKAHALRALGGETENDTRTLLEQALTIAVSQHAKSLELRAARDLAALRLRLAKAGETKP